MNHKRIVMFIIFLTVTSFMLLSLLALHVNYVKATPHNDCLIEDCQIEASRD